MTEYLPFRISAIAAAQKKRHCKVRGDYGPASDRLSATNKANNLSQN
jgi:hypothetical protein